MEFKFGTMSIFELGSTISSMLDKDGITEKSELFVYVDDEQFRKVDEDLFYRNNDGKKEFVPSDGEININFDKVKVIIKKR